MTEREAPAHSKTACMTERAVREALITSGLMHRLHDYARKAYVDMADETEQDLAAAWAPIVYAAMRVAMGEVRP